MLTDVITRTILKKNAGAATFERGDAYFAAGAVARLRATEHTITASVEGTETYKVSLQGTNDELTWQCSCPRAADGYFCKHCVAVGLAWLAEHGQREEPDAKSGRKAQRDPWSAIQKYLSTQSREALCDLVLQAAQSDVRIYDALLLKAEQTGGADAGFAAYRAAINRTTSISGFVDWREAGSFAASINQVVDALEELPLPLNAAMLVELAEYAIERVEQSLEQIDDSNGSVGQVVYRLGELHYKACTMARPDPVKLAERLFRLETTLPFGLCSLDAETYRDVLAESGLRRYRALAQMEWRKVMASGSANAYESRRFRITQMMEKMAKAEGDIEQLVVIKAQDLSSAYRYLAIAEVLADAGQSGKALEWAERGLKAFPERTDNRLRDFVANAYLEQGRTDEALQLVWIQFEENPSLENYRKLNAIAARIGVWPAQREHAFALIADIGMRQPKRAATHWRPSADRPSLLVEIALWENDLDAAWEAANAGTCSQNLLIRLAEQLMSSRPGDAVTLYRRVVPSIVEETSNRAYEQAIQLIRQIGILMRGQHQNEQFGEYLAELNIRYKAKRNFIKLLNGMKG